MAVERLTERMVKQAKTTGVLVDGNGLRLRVSVRQTDAGAVVRKSWIVRVKVKGGPLRELGLGSADTLGLADARVRAKAARQLARDGADPLERRKAEEAQRIADAAKAMTFKQCAERYVAAHANSWRSAKHRQQWINTLAAYAYPVCGDLPVAKVDRGHVAAVLDPIWSVKEETARRVRGRMESVLQWAEDRGYRSGDNPARARKTMPKRAKPVDHHAALPFAEAPGFWTTLAARPGVGALALRFAILTAARTGEVIGMDWREVDFDARVWTVPANRMKAKREHRAPLSAPALALLRMLGPKPAGPVFALSNMALLMTLRRMGRGDLTAHGFRSTFRDWAAERTAFPREVAEAALAHAVGDKVEAAYRRGDLFDKRRKLMDAWAGYLGTPQVSGAKVVAIKTKTAG